MSNTLLLGTRKGLLIVKHSAGQWRVDSAHFPGAPVSYASIDPRSGTLWACLDHGHWGSKLHRSDDMGNNWREIPAPAYPASAVVRPGFPGEAGRSEKPARLSYLWCVIPGPAEQPKRLYIGSEPGGLFVSDDGGETWTLNEALWQHPSRLEAWFGGGRDYAGIDSVLIDPRDPAHLYVAVSCGGVFESTDAGASWHGRNSGLLAEFLPDPHAEYGHDPHYMALCQAHPDVLWQQNHCGIFRSDDGAKTWHKVSERSGPAHFGFPVAVDPVDPNTAWVVPAVSDEVRIAVDGAMCVSRTTDGGKTWVALRAGLPQHDCYDVVFRHALDLSGDALAFGTTTGNAYFSADRGDHWQTISSTLPPVNSVRFVP